MRNIFNKKIISVVLTTLLVLAFIVALVSCVNTGDKTHVIDNNGNELTGNKVHALPSGMTFVSDSEEYQPKTINLTATVKPDNAADKSLQWTINWVNTASEWASGKEIAPYFSYSANGNILTLTCNKPFGEQAKITVSSVSNPNVKAECTVDFEASLSKSFEFYYYENDKDNGVKFGETSKTTEDSDFSSLGAISNHNAEVKLINFGKSITGAYGIKPIAKYGVGTIKPDPKFPVSLKYGSASVSMSDLYYSTYNYRLNPIVGDSLVFELKNGIYKFSSFLIEMSLYNFVDNDTARLNNLVRLSFNNCLFQFVSVNNDFSLCFGLDEVTCNFFKVTNIVVDNSNVIF